MIYLNTVTIDGEYKKKDSCKVLKNGKEITFHIFSGQQQVYALSSSFNNFSVFFINDQGNKVIHADYFSRIYKIKGSPATNSLIHFQKNQSALLRKIDLLNQEKDSTELESLHQEYNQNYINYADTVKSAVAFVIVNDKVDFGEDYEGLERFIERAHRKFKGNAQFDRIYVNAQNYLRKIKKETQLVSNTKDQAP